MVAFGDRAKFTILVDARELLFTVQTSLVLAKRNVVVANVMSSTNQEYLEISGQGFMSSAPET